MPAFRKKVYACAGASSLYFGPGRKEFDPSKPMPSFEHYLKETTAGSLSQVKASAIDEGIIGSFMAAQFLHQGNLAGFLPFLIPELKGKPCMAVEGACGTGGRAIGAAVRSILSDLSDVVFVVGFEVQNCVKAVYGSDILAGAAYYSGERKEGDAFFFPGIFSKRAGAYYEKYGKEKTREAMANWYAQAIEKARKNPKAQEFHNQTKDLVSLGMTAPQPEKFLPHLNPFDCSKVTDGASSILITSEEGLKKLGIHPKDAIEILSLGEAEGDITKPPEEGTYFTETHRAATKALKNASLSIKDLGCLEIHDCFTISGILALEAIGVVPSGKAPDWIMSDQEKLPVNSSGGLIGFGHPTGASGVRMLVDLYEQLTGKAANQQTLKHPYGMLVSMGGNDITVTAVVVKK